jgi:esterase
VESSSQSSNQVSYLSQFHYQLFRGGGQKIQRDQVQNPPINQNLWVFLHGLMGYSLNWRKIIGGLPAEDWILVYDQRGHGQSMKPETGYSPEDYAEDLKKILAELQWTQVNLVGHSMGGRNAFVFAALEPARVRKLVIEDMGPDGDSKAHIYYENLLNSVPTPFASKAQAKEFFYGPFLQTLGLRENVQTLALYFYANMQELEDGRADWRFSKAAMFESVRRGRSKDYWREFQAVQCPTLLIRGERSLELSPATFHRMGMMNSQTRLVEIANAGHWVHYDQAEAFTQEIRKFVNSK